MRKASTLKTWPNRRESSSFWKIHPRHKSIWWRPWPGVLPRSTTITTAFPTSFSLTARRFLACKNPLISSTIGYIATMAIGSLLTSPSKQVLSGPVTPLVLPLPISTTMGIPIFSWPAPFATSSIAIEAMVRLRTSPPHRALIRNTFL